MRRRVLFLAATLGMVGMLAVGAPAYAGAARSRPMLVGKALLTRLVVGCRVNLGTTGGPTPAR